MWRKFPLWLKCGIIAGLIPLLGSLFSFLPNNDFVVAIIKLIDFITWPAWIISFILVLFIGFFIVGDSILGVMFGSGAEPLTSIVGTINVIIMIAFMFLFGALIGKLIDKVRSKKKSH